jgi:hypothetical protein
MALQCRALGVLSLRVLPSNSEVKMPNGTTQHEMLEQ